MENYLAVSALENVPVRQLIAMLHMPVTGMLCLLGGRRSLLRILNARLDGSSLLNFVLRPWQTEYECNYEWYRNEPRGVYQQRPVRPYGTPVSLWQVCCLNALASVCVYTSYGFPVMI
jgi:hypothetical protein